MFIVTLVVCLLKVQAGRCYIQTEGMLYPRESESREVVSLDGLWNFVVPPSNDPQIGFREYWFQKDLTKLENVKIQKMPVPASYNDITVDKKLRDHSGFVWYDRNFFVPKRWNNNTRIWLRFSSVSYAAQVWINGKLAMKHEIGHLPFQNETSTLLNFGGINRVTVACDNTLLSDTVPQGDVYHIHTDEGKQRHQSYSFDFFNYAGIHRPVTLYTTPLSYINDITVVTNSKESTGIIGYNISYVAVKNVTCRVKIFDKDGNLVAQNNKSGKPQGSLLVLNANLWWPYLMHPKPGYLYTIQVELVSSFGDVLDVYRQPIGIRTISWTNTTMLINNRPIYMHGFGRHEDSDIRGKGLDLPTVLRDYNLIKWIGANAYRTSHYPYADEIMDLADQMGIMIIDECPSVDTEKFSDSLLAKHKNSLTELIRRDKNRPSVIMWSIANEPTLNDESAENYFRKIVKHVRSTDRTRPITIASASSPGRDRVAKYLDIISFNRYNGWYSHSGELGMITSKVIDEARKWHKKHNKPVLVSEYGADAISGLRELPSFIWTEEYQVELMSKHFKAFDTLRKDGFFIGEFIWNFADFKTAQGYTRVAGNKKGMFTRNREPKASAYHLRKRYWALSHQLYNVSLPTDLSEYILSGFREEL